MLVVVKNRNIDPLAQFTLDVKAFRRLDIFEVDTTERRFEARNDIDEALGVGFVDLDVEHVDAGKLLEQDALAFHDRLCRERTDIPQAQHRATVRNDGHEISPGGVQRGGIGVFRNLFARRSNPR